jgi:hypothetical protein
VHNEADTVAINHNWFAGAALPRVADFLEAELAATRAALADLDPGRPVAGAGEDEDDGLGCAGDPYRAG